MSEPDEAPKRPKQSARTTIGKAARAARLAEAMRQNLHKRKRQQRSQREPEPEPTPEADESSDVKRV